MSPKTASHLVAAQTRFVAATPHIVAAQTRFVAAKTYLMIAQNTPKFTIFPRFSLICLHSYTYSTLCNMLIISVACRSVDNVG